MTLQTPPGNIDSQTSLCVPCWLKKTRSSQSEDSPNWSLGCLGFEGTWSMGIKAFRRRVQREWEQWPYLTELICWPAGSPVDLQPFEGGSHVHSSHWFTSVYSWPLALCPAPGYHSIYSYWDELLCIFTPGTLFTEEIWQLLMDLKVHALPGILATLAS